LFGVSGVLKSKQECWAIGCSYSVCQKLVMVVVILAITYFNSIEIQESRFWPTVLLRPFVHGVWRVMVWTLLSKCSLLTNPSKLGVFLAAQRKFWSFGVLLAIFERVFALWCVTKFKSVQFTGARDAWRELTVVIVQYSVLAWILPWSSHTATI